MKKTVKILAVLVALTLALSFSIIAFAQVQVTNEIAPSADGASITVNLPTVEEGKEPAVADNTYKIYKLFDATVDPDTGAISYHTNASTMPAGFIKDAQGNVRYENANGNGEDLTSGDIAAIAAWVEDGNGQLVATVTTEAGDTSFTVEDLPYGYYYITTTTGTLVTVDSLHPTATVNDKNEIPPVEKVITASNGTADTEGTLVDVDAAGKNAMSQVGTIVDFEATITKEDGGINYKFHDTMSTGLTFNDDVVVTVNGETVNPGSTTYTLGKEGTDTFTINFNNTYIKNLADETDIVITYSATVNENALITDFENNTCQLDYGDDTGENHTTKPEVKVYDATIKVNKYVPGDNNSQEPLAGAGFVLKNADGKYYKLVDGVVTWVDSINDATEYLTDDTGALADGASFTGLPSGTYYLEEKTVPDGFNKAPDTEVVIVPNDYTAENLVQIADVANEPGTVLPSTGGIGTTIFYIAGGALVIVAAVVLIVRRRTKATVA